MQYILSNGITILHAGSFEECQEYAKNNLGRNERVALGWDALPKRKDDLGDLYIFCATRALVKQFRREGGNILWHTKEPNSLHRRICCTVEEKERGGIRRHLSYGYLAIPDDDLGKVMSEGAIPAQTGWKVLNLDLSCGYVPFVYWEHSIWSYRKLSGALQYELSERPFFDTDAFLDSRFTIALAISVWEDICEFSYRTKAIHPSFIVPLQSGILRRERDNDGNHRWFKNCVEAAKQELARRAIQPHERLDPAEYDVS